ncbi:hypothetical protein NITHO_3760010 [Nitrolancea hollandica Lb]|uniref:Uncharacterized protein n=1 Tax=Nitrolancea hollandica Lb TaxID=1129897 RepID=I4EJ19_9BACT|nr:hypothetical protein NITHO_3760010 [Nitrolancea hollandica Lb]
MMRDWLPAEHPSGSAVGSMPGVLDPGLTILSGLFSYREIWPSNPAISGTRLSAERGPEMSGPAGPVVGPADHW